MLEVDPEKRISAKEAVNHRFFENLEDTGMVIETDTVAISNNFQEYNLKY